MIQISTDYVFNGSKNIAYEPYDSRDPLQVYGKSKALAEKAVETLLFPLNKAKILRTSWIMSPFGNNFALTIHLSFVFENLLIFLNTQDSFYNLILRFFYNLFLF